MRSGVFRLLFIGLVVPTLALLASHRHCDALACCHRSTTSGPGTGEAQVTTGPPGPPAEPRAARQLRAAPRAAEAGGRRLRGGGLGEGGGAQQAGGGALQVEPGARPARARPRAPPPGAGTRVTSGGRALALGEPAERTRWQRVWTSATVTGAGRRSRAVGPPPIGSSSVSRALGVDREEEAPAAAGRARTPPRRRTRRARGRRRGRARAAAPRCAASSACSAAARGSRGRGRSARDSSGRSGSSCAGGSARSGPP